MTLKVDKSEYIAAHETLVKELGAAIKYQSMEAGAKQGTSDHTARTIAVVGSVGWVVMLFLELLTHAFR
jgi:hypothetical protein